MESKGHLEGYYEKGLTGFIAHEVGEGQGKKGDVWGRLRFVTYERADGGPIHPVGTPGGEAGLGMEGWRRK